MSKINLSGDPSGTGTITIAAPNTNSSATLTLPTASGTLGFSNKIEVGDSKVEVTDTGSNGKITGTADGTAVFSVEKDKTFVLQGGASSTGVGIAFPATQSASSNANTLDDYEEGTFTVSALLPNTSGTITVSSTQNTLKYTKIGRVVYINGYVQPSSVASPVGFYIELNGLPFNTSSSSSPTTGANYQSGVAQFYYNNNAGTGQVSKPIVVPNNGGTNCFIYVDASTVANTTEIYVNINYAV